MHIGQIVSVHVFHLWNLASGGGHRPKAVTNLILTTV